MEVRILIKTPKGQAKKTEKKLRPFIVGRKANIINEVRANEDDDKIIWVLRGEPRKLMKVHQNACRYDNIVRKLLGNRMVEGAVKKLSKEDQKTLKQMLIDQTTVEVISVEEYETIYKATLWEKIKEKIF